MEIEAKTYLFDMQYACSFLPKFMRRKLFADYEKDELLQSAVERQFEVLGEALAQLHKIAPQIAYKITDYRKIIDFRNLLIHGYATVSNAVVWGVVETNLPILCAELKKLLNS